MNVLMVGVGSKRVGGMWTVAEQYISNSEFNSKVNLTYIPTSTNGNIVLRTLFMLVGYLRILWVLNTKKIDIVHIHMAEKGSTFRKGRVAKWARHRNKKVIIHLHAGPFMAWYKTVSIDKQEKIRQFFGCADIVLVLGEYWKNELQEIIPKGKMQVLYNGVKCPDENPYNPNAKYIVYFGVMKREKGIYDLINAINETNDKLPNDVKVVLCGNDLEGNIPEIIENKGLKNRFELPGWVSGEKKEQIYKKAVIDVLPSYYEGLSMTLLEAMSRGIPIISTNISTMSEVVGKNGILIDPGDVTSLGENLLNLLSNIERRKEMSQKEFERAKDLFSDVQFIDKTLELYSSILQK